jgi:hypothetical protein
MRPDEFPPIPKPTEDKPVIDLSDTEYGKFIERVTGYPCRNVLVLCGHTYTQRISIKIRVVFPVEAGNMFGFKTDHAEAEAKKIARDKLEKEISQRQTQINCLSEFSNTDDECELKVEAGEFSYSVYPNWNYTLRTTGAMPLTFLEEYIVEVEASSLVKFRCVWTP